MDLLRFFLDPNLVEREYYEHRIASCDGDEVGYCYDALVTFQTVPTLRSNGRLCWPHRVPDFETKGVDAVRVARSGERVGYDPYPFMESVVVNRLGNDAEARVRVISAFRSHAHRFGLASAKCFDQLFIAHVPATHMHIFNVAQSTHNARIRKGLVSVGRVVRDWAGGARGDEFVEGLLKPLVLLTDTERGLVQAFRRSCGIYDRTLRTKDRIVTIRSEPASWKFNWRDCKLRFRDEHTLYERADERLKWTCCMFADDRVPIERVPVNLLLNLKFPRRCIPS